MGKLQVMTSNHVGLKIAAVAKEDWDYEAKVDIFNTISVLSNKY